MQRLFIKNLFIIFIFGFCFYGCATKLANYAEFAPFNHPSTKSKKIRIPVIIVPGIKGSLLKDNNGKGKAVWGDSDRIALFYKFDELQFQLTPQLDENFVRDFKSYYYNERKIENGGIMKNYSITFLGVRFFKISVYKRLIDALIDTGGYTLVESTNNGDPNQSKLGDLFTFSYDWRLDNRISAVYLADKVKDCQKNYKAFLKQTLKTEFPNYWEKLKKENLLTEDGQIKVNLVTHSMGGLISRYYLQVLGGYKYVNRLIMLGTPYMGSMRSLKALAEGEYLESVIHFYSPSETRKVILTWPSIYQFLPRYPNLLYSLEEGKRVPIPNMEGWGLSSSKISTESLEKALNNWKKYNLIPDPKELEENENVVSSFIKQQLLDGINFHKAINGDCDETYEKHRLNQIKSFIKSEDFEFPEEDFQGPITTPFIFFGGHCEPTVTSAVLSTKNGNRPHLVFISPKDHEPVDGTRTVSLGDGGVPTESLTSPGREQDFQFLLCEDHFGLVKNKTFQYNLIRILLGQTYYIF